MLEGAVLNQRYRLLNRLGEGGMAQVYRAEDLLLGRPVAIKALREDLARDESFLARFRAEARAAANLSHPNIAAIYDVGFDAGRHYIVMEYVEGPTLKDLIRQGAPFPVDRAVDIAAQVLAGLDHAHAKGLIHRDVKPQNVLLTPDGRAKVVDFGIARQLAAASTTMAGQVFGTALYISPEQVRGEEVSAAADVYAVGVMLYEMLTGRLPFTGDSPVVVAAQHRDQPPPPPRRFNPAIPPRLEAVVLQALAKAPESRFPSASAMRQALTHYAQQAAEVTAPIGIGPRPAGAAPSGPLPQPSVVAGSATAGTAQKARGFSWTTTLLLVASFALLALLIPIGALFNNAILQPILNGRQVSSPVATASPAAGATPIASATPTATQTPTPTRTSTATPSPTASPPPRYPAWMRFIVAEEPRLQLVKDPKQRLGEVRGQILDRNGKPVPGLKVKIESEDGGWSALRPRANIDEADGTFRFDQLNRGRYKVTVLDAGNNPLSQTAVGLNTEDVDKDFKGYPIWYVTFREPTD